MEETLNQSKFDVSKGIRSNLKDSFILRPSTPLKMPSFNLDKNKPEMDVAERQFAFMPRPKIAF
jgi:hypothetical protein